MKINVARQVFKMLNDDTELMLVEDMFQTRDRQPKTLDQHLHVDSLINEQSNLVMMLEKSF